MERSSSCKLRSLTSSMSLHRCGSKSFRSLLSRSGSKCRDWATLAPELFALVVQKVQQRGTEDKGEGRRVVALAGVCRSWRQLILDQLTSDSPLLQTGLLQFPSALTQPGPRSQPLQCILRRKRGLIRLFQSYDPVEDLEEMKFLMAARWRWRLGGCYYEITANPKSFSKHAPGYIGRLKSNFWGSHFSLFKYKKGTNRVGYKGSAGKVKTKVVAVQFTEHLLDHGVRQRRISCVLPHPSSEAAAIILETTKHVHFLPSAFRSCIGDTHMEIQGVRSNRRQHILAGCGVRIKDEDTSVERLVEKDVEVSSLELRSKIPAWDEEQRCWSLDFKGRATLSSMHNFQLILGQNQPVAVDDQNLASRVDQTDQSDGATSSGQEVIVLQVGKIGKGLYTLDFCYPLSAFQALAICLSSFATNVGLEA